MSSRSRSWWSEQNLAVPGGHEVEPVRSEKRIFTPVSANRRLEEALRTEPAGGIKCGGLLANDSRRQSVG
jgi:hypothetical protein